MFNSALLNPRSIAIIAAITLITRVVAKPIFNAIDNKAK